jgi:queuine tRNA-ribosyltransferase
LASVAAEPDAAPWVIYDVGLGIAANSLAVLEHLGQSQTASASPWIDRVSPRIEMISFETELDGIKRALQRPELFPFLERNQEIVRTLLEQSVWTGQLASGIHFNWELKLGDFRTRLSQCPKADLFFFDLYSPKSLPELWSYQTFQLLAEKCHQPKNSLDLRETALITYSASTAVRAALLLNGFYVGKGKSTAGKKETTLATTRRNSLENPLSKDWLDHWQRSSQPLPRDLAEPSNPEKKEQILSQLRAIIEVQALSS